MVCVLTGHGLKDPHWAARDAPEPIVAPPDAAVIAARLHLPER